MVIRCLILLILPWLFIFNRWTEGQSETPAKQPSNNPARLRRPVALALGEKGQRLYVANQCSGTISLIDLPKQETLGEVEIGGRPADLIPISKDGHLLAVDEEAHELLWLAPRAQSLVVLQRLRVSPYPVSVQVSRDGYRCFVTSLWSRKLTIIERPENVDAPEGTEKKWRITKTVALPFAPRKQLPLQNDSKLVVADSFGGKLALVDVPMGEVQSVRSLPAHNIRGLALSGDGKELLVAHQVLNPLAEATRDDIHWGNLITNNVRGLLLSNVLNPKGDLLRGSRLHQLGEVGNGGGDPAGLVVTPSGTMVVPLAGVGEIALNPESYGQPWHRLTVGHHPTAICLGPDGHQAFVANTFNDSISVVDLSGEKVQGEISLGPKAPLRLTDRGEMLFYDARLSLEGWMSCHSCHSDGHTTGLLNDNLGDNSFGAPKRILSLMGVNDTGPWAWNGGISELNAQVRKSMVSTMHGPKPTEEQVEVLTAYLKTLPPPPSRLQGGEELDERALKSGKEIFNRQGCASCHTPPTYTSQKTYDVGLHDEVGNTHFNPPSLRGISQGGPFFHDNRAATLEKVFTQFRHQLKTDLKPTELKDLMTFLESLF